MDIYKKITPSLRETITYRRLWVIFLAIFITSIISFLFIDNAIIALIVILSAIIAFVSFTIWIFLLLRKKNKKLLGIVVLFVMFVIFLSIFVFDSKAITGSSMEPVLSNNQCVLMEKVSYIFKNPTRRDIVIFKGDDGGEYVGRIIGLPEEIVSIKNNDVYIDGSYYQENGIDWSDFKEEEFQEAELKEKEYLMMLDKRSTQVRVSNIDNILGKLVFGCFPISKIGLIK